MEPDYEKLEADIERERLERERKIDEAAARLVVNDMLAAIAAKCL